MQSIKIGLLGAGTVAEYGHLPALSSMEGAEVVAIADLDPQRAEKLANCYSIPKVYDNYQDLLALPQLDAVVVATPVETHKKIVMAAAKRNVHVLCEKPIAPSPEEGRQMTEAMEERGLVFAINFLLRFSEPLVTMKKWVEAGKIGKIVVMRLIFNSAGPGWRSKERLDALMTKGGGPIFDCGVHYFDLARWFTGSEFYQIQARGAFLRGYPNPDHVLCTCRLTDGTIALIEESWIYTLGSRESRRYRCYELIGERGTIAYNTDTAELVLFTEDKPVRIHIPPEKKAFCEVYEQFFACIKQGSSVGIPSGLEGVRAVEAAKAALDAIERDCGKQIGCLAANI
jgi:predicted dehydrogenase